MTDDEAKRWLLLNGIEYKVCQSFYFKMPKDRGTGIQHYVGGDYQALLKAVQDLLYHPEYQGHD